LVPEPTVLERTQTVPLRPRALDAKLAPQALDLLDEEPRMTAPANTKIAASVFPADAPDREDTAFARLLAKRVVIESVKPQRMSALRLVVAESLCREPFSG
jgi:hypothetical protein